MKSTTQAFIFSFIFLAFPQEKADKSISGIVTDHNNGKPLKAVFITISKPQRSVLTDSLGRFVFQNIPWGRYELRFTRDGYITMVFRDVPVDDDRRLPLLVNMSKAPIPQDGMKIYVPDSTIDYKIRIYDPTKKARPDPTYH